MSELEGRIEQYRTRAEARRAAEQAAKPQPTAAERQALEEYTTLSREIISYLEAHNVPPLPIYQMNPYTRALEHRTWGWDMGGERTQFTDKDDVWDFYYALSIEGNLYYRENGGNPDGDAFIRVGSIEGFINHTPAHALSTLRHEHVTAKLSELGSGARHVVSRGI